MNRRNFIAAMAAMTGATIANRAAAFTDFKLGTAPFTSLSDGYYDFPQDYFSDTSETEKKALGSPVRLAANTFLHRTGNRVIMFDAGAGRGEFISKQFTTVGRLPDELAGAGVSPEEVTDVVITHMHPDHIGGLTTGGVPSFPNAKIHISAADWDFWTRKGFADSAPEGMRPMVQMVQDVATAVSDNVSTYSGTADLGDGVAIEPAPGHTPGNQTILVNVGGEQLLIVGDIVVSEKVHFSNPKARWAFDFDSDMALETRTAMLDRAATDKLMIAAAHITDPGLGYVERDGKGYRFVPI